MVDKWKAFSYNITKLSFAVMVIYGWMLHFSGFSDVMVRTEIFVLLKCLAYRSDGNSN